MSLGKSLTIRCEIVGVEKSGGPNQRTEKIKTHLTLNIWILVLELTNCICALDRSAAEKLNKSLIFIEFTLPTS